MDYGVLDKVIKTLLYSMGQYLENKGKGIKIKVDDIDDRLRNR